MSMVFMTYSASTHVDNVLHLKGRCGVRSSTRTSLAHVLHALSLLVQGVLIDISWLETFWIERVVCDESMFLLLIDFNRCAITRYDSYASVFHLGSTFDSSIMEYTKVKLPRIYNSKVRPRIILRRVR